MDKCRGISAPIVAVLGLGAMGLPMATRLATQFPVLDFDAGSARRQLGADAGVTACISARDADSRAHVVLVDVRNGEQLSNLLFGEEGIAASLAKGSVVILTSTVGSDAIPSTVAELAEFDVVLVDASLSGGPLRLGAGELLVVVGADPQAREEVTPVLEALTTTITVVGNYPGAGQGA